MSKILKITFFIFLISIHTLATATLIQQENKMHDNLTQELATLAKTYPGKVGLYLHDLKTNQKITLNADDSFFMASTYKVPMLVQLYRDHDAGLLSVNDKITLTPEMTTSGYGLLKSFSPGTALSLKDIYFFFFRFMPGAVGRD